MKPLDTGKYGSALQNLSEKAYTKSPKNAELQKELTKDPKTLSKPTLDRQAWFVELIEVVTETRKEPKGTGKSAESVIRDRKERWGDKDAGDYGKVIDHYDTNGKPQKEKEDAKNPTSSTSAGSGKDGPAYDGFLSEEKQSLAYKRALGVAMTYQTYTQAEYFGLGGTPWKDIDRCLVVVRAGKGDSFGVTFRKTAHFVRRKREEVLELIESILEGRKGSTVKDPVKPVDYGKGDGKKDAKGGDKVGDKGSEKGDTKTKLPKLDGLADLLDYLGVEAVWQNMALVILARKGAQWHRVAEYVCDLEGEGWAPGNRVAGKCWTGRIRTERGVQLTLPVPCWTPH